MSRPLTALVCALALVMAACGGDEGASESGDGGDRRAEAAAEPQGPCADVEQPPPRDDGGQTRPRKRLEPGRTYHVTLETSCGEITIRLDQRTSPNAAASFVSLARNGFFDDTIFHRIIPDYVIQAGDPTVVGEGDPGYSTRDRVPPGTTYDPGVVAMARSGADPPGTAGSQFFVVIGSAAGLPPEYAPLGRVTKGMDVARAIGQLGDPASGDEGRPLQSVVIEDVAIRAR